MDYVRKIIAIAIFLLALIIALALPFTYQSMTLWYKFGLNKTILRAGQLAGMFALILLFTQIVLAAGGDFLEKAFSLEQILKSHRVNGLLILFFALTHIFLVLLPEGLANLPFGKKFWPEMVGSFLLLLLIIIVISSRYRKGLKLSYRQWRTIHKPLGYLTCCLAVIHVLFVSDSFTQAVPRWVLLGSFAGLLIRVVWVKVYARIQKTKVLSY